MFTSVKNNIPSKISSLRAEAGRAEIYLYGILDAWSGISAVQFKDEIEALGEFSILDVYFNSPGGNIAEGMAFYSILKRQKAKVIVHVDGIAASMASVVAMAADEIVMGQGTYMMIHNPLGAVYGEAGEMRDYADLLDKMKGQIAQIYSDRCKQSVEDIVALMDVQTWFTADEAIAGGFADRLGDNSALSASFDLSRFNNLPKSLQGVIPVTKENETKTPDQVRAELVSQTKDYSDRFGVELAAKWGPLGEGKPLLECYAEFVAKIRAENDAALTSRDTAHKATIIELAAKLDAAEKKATDLETRLGSLGLGEKTPVSGLPGNQPEGKSTVGMSPVAAAFSSEFQLPASNNK